MHQATIGGASLKTQAKTKTDLIEALEVELGLLRRRMERSRNVVSSVGGLHIERAAYSILGRLESEGPARLSAIAHFFGLDVSTMSRQVTTLEADGLVERIPDPDDGRAHLLQLTKPGRAAFAELRRNKRALLSNRLAGWSTDDCETFVNLLSRYNAEMESGNT